MINVREFGPQFGDVGEVSAGMPNTELSVAGATRSTLARSATVRARPLGLHADSGHDGRAMILCTAGDVHGALDRLFEDVLAFDESSALRGEREEDAALPVSWRRWTPVIQRARR